jgi:hypothetical protein
MADAYVMPGLGNSASIIPEGHAALSMFSYETGLSSHKFYVLILRASSPPMILFTEMFCDSCQFSSVMMTLRTWISRWTLLRGVLRSTSYFLFLGNKHG